MTTAHCPQHDVDAVALSPDDQRKLSALEARLTRTRLAREMGISATTIDRLVSGGRAKRETTERVARKLLDVA